MSTGQHIAKSAILNLPLAALTIIIGLSCASVGEPERSADQSDTPNGLIRVFKTLETSKRAKCSCDLLQYRTV